ncbi:TPA: TetR/AcrR family transcriptional regulator [Legionella pneumophila]|uniref:TetR/AcrR family transcriptional regulator n=2 Tax=Legionella pneumophila TaxID=446 RepID=A0AAN5PRV0_LEGPN|nr:TetR/AcrR family transcriptional regulator [Legionella pneumophila]HAT8821612.1 TetR family transcriptional regulator [Legionella pneumophila subsp. pneumophila]PYB54950.1 TetR/AcrR family transcriptional regulator [Legionella pneumophila]PYB60919.1 TetR/AcrR family transcriptional regulator [Legionella pneumophila]RYX21369.1 TetR/AcrR family transcriptional regulator [Legionella pneumophila]
MPMNISNTKERILAVAEALIQKDGYNAFSFKDIATAINIKTASIHYHFPSKEDLGVAVISWHADKIAAVLSDISNNLSLSAKEKIQKFFEAILTITYNAENKMCLGGMFASDFQSLPVSIQNQAKKFFELIIEWLKGVLETSAYDNESALSVAKQIISLIEGGLLLARLYGDETFLEGVRHFIDQTIK